MVNQLRQTMFAFTMATFSQGALLGALPGVNSYLPDFLQRGDANTPGTRVANSIGTIDVVLGLLKDDALKQPLDTVVNSATQLKDLKETTRRNQVVDCRLLCPQHCLNWVWARL